MTKDSKWTKTGRGDLTSISISDGKTLGTQGGMTEGDLMSGDLTTVLALDNLQV